MACRLIPLKNIPSVINLVRYLNTKGFDVYLDIAGEGPEKKKIKDLILNDSANSRVNLLGFQKDLAKFYKNIDIYVIASDTEDLPLSMTEAMSYGCPVISSDVGGIKTIVNEGEGLVVAKINEEYYAIIEDYLKKIDFKKSFSINRDVAYKYFHKKSFENLFNTIYN